MTNLKTINILYNYATMYKKKFILAFLILILSTVCVISGPVIIKKIIDDHINGVMNYSWYMSNSNENLTTKNIQYNEYFFIREDWVDSPNSSWEKVDIQKIDNQYSVTNNGSQLYSIDTIHPFYSYEYKPIGILLGIFLLLILLGNLLKVLQEYYFNTTAIDAVRRIRLDLFKKIHNTPIKFIDQTTSGQLITQVSHDTEEIKRLYINFISTYVVNIVTLIGIFIFMFILDVKLALFALFLLPFYFFAGFLHVKYSKRFVTEVRIKVAEINTLFKEIVSGISIIKAFNSEKTFQDQFAKLNQDRYISNLKQIQVEKLSGWNIVDLLKTLFFAFIIWYFGTKYLSTENVISVGVMYAFLDYISRMVNPMVSMLEQLSEVQRAVVSADKSLVLLNYESVIDNPDYHKPFQMGSIIFKNVSFSYDDKQDVLKQTSFDIQPGETVAIVGKTGSGKSTIINLLLKFYKANRGNVTIDGVDINEYSTQELRKNIGYVSQDPHIFAGDLFFNIGLYNQNNHDQIITAAKIVGADKFISEMPLGYHTVLSERGSELSSGQKQLITFARAIVNNPSILILDEATAKIDSESEEDISTALNKIVSGRTTIIIAHRLNTIKNSDKIIVMDNGQVVEEGRHEELINKKEYYYRLYTLQKISKEALAT
ncbi:ABC transporter ATP-binding protein [Cytobacillus purgationiresistens]|uniref:ATP-binding cassette subfamily B protein n=1 Tax=Cytobacillus purgationiresistens TaxID=863449 RepID=A0ABU0ANW5_9BACI|nr:ABC transporter ATP-binding protein [Cytobacillus purgationiresistens]MDQ0272957.1 ATP-binding cassette subfamily B protein [Cytobacillus purgationiresistens]